MSERRTLEEMMEEFREDAPPRFPWATLLGLVTGALIWLILVGIVYLIGD